VNGRRSRRTSMSQEFTISVNSSRPRAAASHILALLPISALVFIAYLVIGLALPVLPIHVHEGLSLGTFAVGLVVGSQFAASLASRLFAGHHADRRGPSAQSSRWSLGSRTTLSLCSAPGAEDVGHPWFTNGRASTAYDHHASNFCQCDITNRNCRSQRTAGPRRGVFFSK
jgi:hypothetical protein